MKINFTKMHGCGNDYIYIDCFKYDIKNPEELAVKLSRRHFSVGSDGIILICPSDVADAKMRMFNADGSEGKMCGNGIRCVAKFVHDNKISANNPLKIETLSGIKTINLLLDKKGICYAAGVDMGAPILNPKDIPAKFDACPAVNQTLTVGKKDYTVTAVSMGNPHCVVFVDKKTDVWNMKIESIGKKFENHPAFPERVNTEFVKVVSPELLEMRVWERGSGETYACGTGACASVVASCLCGYSPMNVPVTVRLLGGELKITYTKETVIMEGPAETAYYGKIDI